jgi:hypothetical protein
MQTPKQLIIAALRSGEYKQGHGLLRNGRTGCFCIAGVICDVAAKAGHGEWLRWLDSWCFVLDGPQGFAYHSFMPDSVMSWVGFKHDQLDHPVYGPTSIYGLNDRYKITFKEFADLLEKQL